MKQSFLMVAFLLMVVTSGAQGSSTITFRVLGKSNSTYRILVAEPLDGAYNSKAGTFNQTVTDSSEVKFTPKQKYPAIISVEIAGRSIKLIVVPNNSIQVDVYPQDQSSDGVVFRGDNAAGQKWINSYLPVQTLVDIQKIFKDNRKNYLAIYTGICNYVDASLRQIDSLKIVSNLSDAFSAVLRKNKLAELYFVAINEYNGTLFGMKDSDFTVQDSIAIRESQNKIFEKFPPLSPDILTYTFGGLYISNYFVTVEDKNASHQGYLSVFGPWGQYGILPEVLRKPQLGEAILYQYAYSENQFDKEKATAYFRKEYPDSEYLPQIDRLAAKAKQAQSAAAATNNVRVESASVAKSPNSDENNGRIIPFDKAVHIDTSAVVKNLKSLREFHETYFKGRKIFIDLWATWCRPCREEFNYKERTDSLLELHHILPVFLSIDVANLKQRWIYNVTTLKLSGYHFMVNDTLLEDIRKIIYDGKPLIDIPRYIYMDEEGNIISKDAPRPSNIKELRKLFVQNK